MQHWIADYIKAQKAAHDSIPVETVAQFVETLRVAHREDRQVFVFGNGGSAANASHFATDLGKGASDKLGKRFRVLCYKDEARKLAATRYKAGMPRTNDGALLFRKPCWPR